MTPNLNCERRHISSITCRNSLRLSWDSVPEALIHGRRLHGMPFAPLNGMNKSNIVVLFIITFLVILPASPANANGRFNAIISGKSYHFNSTYHWNEKNVGLGIEYELFSTSMWRTTLMANAFRDSTNNMSYMAGGGLHRRLFHTDRLSGLSIYAGLNAFAMTRDDVENSRPFPGILPSLTIGNDKLGLNLTYLPRKAVEATTNSSVVDPTISGILFVQLTIGLDRLLPQRTR